MNKSDLTKAIAANAGFTQKQAAKALEALINNVEETVAAGEKITVIGFGTFAPKAVKAKTARNPRTGETIKVPARIVPAFTAGKTFKDKINK